MTVAEIAAWLHGRVVGKAETEIVRPAKIEEAGPGGITFLANLKYTRHIAATKASAVLVGPDFNISSAGRNDVAFIIVDDPYAAFLRVLKRLIPPPEPFFQGIHPTAVISASATLGENVSVGPLSVVGDDVVIGRNTKVGAHVVLGKNASIAEHCVLYDNVTVYHGCRIGSRTVVHSGTVIGSDGFGFVQKPDGSYDKIAQLGIVRIDEDCEIGANCTVDRATIGETWLQRGVKLDNMVQIAHNVEVGEHTAFAAQSGVSGSSKIGAYCRIAGQVGIAGHLEIADHTTILGQTGVSKSITEPGKTWFGTPHMEHVRAGRVTAVLHSLPELRSELTALQKVLEELKRSMSK